jgi:hypothetical protein
MNQSEISGRIYYAGVRMPIHPAIEYGTHSTAVRQ